MTHGSVSAAAEPALSPESDPVDHRLVGARLRPLASGAVIAKSVDAGIAAGLSEELAETLAHAAADQQQLRKALRSAKIQRFGAEEFTYIEVDVLTWRIVPSPDNIRFEGEHARGTIGMPRFGAVDGQPLLTFEMESAISPERRCSGAFRRPPRYCRSPRTGRGTNSPRPSTLLPTSRTLSATSEVRSAPGRSVTASRSTCWPGGPHGGPA